MPEEQPSLKRLQLTVTPRQLEMLQARATALQIPVSELVRRVLDTWLDGVTTQPPIVVQPYPYVPVAPTYPYVPTVPAPNTGDPNPYVPVPNPYSPYAPTPLPWQSPFWYTTVGDTVTYSSTTAAGVGDSVAATQPSEPVVKRGPGRPRKSP